MEKNMAMNSGKMQQNKQRAASPAAGAASRVSSSAPAHGVRGTKPASSAGGVKKSPTAGGLKSPNGKPMALAAKKAAKARFGAK